MNTNDKLINDFIAHLKMCKDDNERVAFLRHLPAEDMIKPVAYALYLKGRKLSIVAKIYDFKRTQLYHRMKCIFEDMGQNMEEEAEETIENENKV